MAHLATCETRGWIPPGACLMRTIAFATACYTLLVALVYLLVRWVENRPAQDGRRRYPSLRYFLMAGRRPAPLRVQLWMLVLVAGAVLVIALLW